MSRLARWMLAAAVVAALVVPLALVEGKPAQDRPDRKALTVDLGGGQTMKFVRIEPGTFLMGSPKEEAARQAHEAQHEVEITQPFYLGVFEVTQAQFRQLMGSNPSYFSPQGGGKDQVTGKNTDDFPVDQVTWPEAVQFCEKLTALGKLRRLGLTAALPTEAEWEFACRAGTKTVFHYGDALSSLQANVGLQPYGGAAPRPRPGPAPKDRTPEPHPPGPHAPP